MCAPVAQLDRATDYESVGREFESLRAHHLNQMSFIMCGQLAAFVFFARNSGVRVNLHRLRPIPQQTDSPDPLL